MKIMNMRHIAVTALAVASFSFIVTGCGGNAKSGDAAKADSEAVDSVKDSVKAAKAAEPKQSEAAKKLGLKPLATSPSGEYTYYLDKKNLAFYIDNPAAGKLDKIDFVEKYELININPGEITDYSVRKDKVVFIIFNGGNTSEMEGYYGAYFSMKDNKMHDITFTPAMKFNKDKSVLEVFEPTSPYPYPEGKDVTYDLDKL
mgnify:FL=1